MTEKIDFEKVPHNYAMCLNAQCALSSTCLRYLAAESGKNGVDCYSKNGHAVTVLTRQS